MVPADAPRELVQQACSEKIYGLSRKGGAKSARTGAVISLAATFIGCLLTWDCLTTDWATVTFEHVGEIPLLGLIAMPVLAVVKEFPALPVLLFGFITVCAALLAFLGFRQAARISSLPSMSLACPGCGARLELSAYYNTESCEVVCPACYVLFLGPLRSSLRKRSCAQCGLQFFAASDPPKCPSCRFAATAAAAKCPQCGQQQREGVLYCSSCDSWVGKDAFADVLLLSPKVASAYLTALLMDVGTAVERVVVPANCEIYGPNGLWLWLKDQLTKLDKATLVTQWLSAVDAPASSGQLETFQKTLGALQDRLAPANLNDMRQKHRKKLEAVVRVAEHTLLPSVGRHSQRAHACKRCAINREGDKNV